MSTAFLPAGALAGGGHNLAAEAGTGAQADKNAVDNNLLGNISAARKDQLTNDINNGYRFSDAEEEYLRLTHKDEVINVLLDAYKKDPKSLS